MKALELLLFGFPEQNRLLRHYFSSYQKNYTFDVVGISEVDEPSTSDYFEQNFKRESMFSKQGQKQYKQELKRQLFSKHKKLFKSTFQKKRKKLLHPKSNYFKIKKLDSGNRQTSHESRGHDDTKIETKNDKQSQEKTSEENNDSNVDETKEKNVKIENKNNFIINRENATFVINKNIHKTKNIRIKINLKESPEDKKNEFARPFISRILPKPRDLSEKLSAKEIFKTKASFTNKGSTSNSK